MRQIKSELKDRIDQVLNSLSYPQKDYTLTPPKNIQYGDLSTNIALVLAQDLKTSPMDIAKIFVNEIVKYDIDNIINISIHKPGFINFEISKNYFQSQISKIIKLSIKYGKGSIGAGKSANVEFVSANPTGPLTIGHGRNAILGDVVSNILKWQGYDVTREYYFNDAGRQMRILAKSVEALYFKLLGENIQIPEDGYQGEYLKDIAKVIVNEDGRNLEKGSNVFKEKTEKIIFHEIKQSLKNLGVKFDQFINEKTFYENGDIKNLLENLRKKDLIYEKDNATWFKTSVLGKKQDRVYIKSSGEPTYRVPDTAYHRDKIKRNYDLIIDVFGADHADELDIARRDEQHLQRVGAVVAILDGHVGVLAV